MWKRQEEKLNLPPLLSKCPL